jgi:hypothetical protein
MNHKQLINDFVARLSGCKVKFYRGSEKLGDSEITMYYKFGETADTVSIQSLISNQLSCMGLEWYHLPFSDDLHTWLISGKESQSVWHVVVYKEAGEMTIQWKVQTNQ